MHTFLKPFIILGIFFAVSAEHLSWEQITEATKSEMLSRSSGGGASKSGEGNRQWIIRTAGPLSQDALIKLENKIGHRLDQIGDDENSFVLMGGPTFGNYLSEVINREEDQVAWIGIRMPQQKLLGALRDSGEKGKKRLRKAARKLSVNDQPSSSSIGLLAKMYNYIRGKNAELNDATDNKMNGTVLTLRVKLVDVLPTDSTFLARSWVDQGLVPYAHALSNKLIAVRCPLESCHDIAANVSTQPEVMVIDYVPKYKTNNYYTTKILTEGNQTGNWFSNALYDMGLTGTGQILGISDSGIDYDNCYFYGGNTPPENLVDLNQRKIIAYYTYSGMKGCSEPAGFQCGDYADTNAGHGTHVAGTAVGNVLQSYVASNLNLFQQYNGVAYNAKIFFTDIGNATEDLNVPPAWSTIFDDPYKAGVRIHSNSWGCAGDPSCYQYGIDDNQVDEYQWKHKDFLVLVAAGNDGDLDLYGTTSSPALAKNIISVGASMKGAQGTAASTSFIDPNDYLSNADTPPACVDKGTCTVQYCCSLGYLDCCANSFASRSQIYSQNNLAYYSSRGLTSDSRFKPDLVTPGDSVVSAKSDGAVGTVAGQPSVKCYPPVATSSQYSQNAGLTVKSGTSMATPLAAGSAVLIRQFYTDGYYPDGIPSSQRGFVPSAALIKATMINIAMPLTGLAQLSADAVKKAPKASTTQIGNDVYWDFSAGGVKPTSPFYGFGLPDFKLGIPNGAAGSVAMWIDDNMNGVVTGENILYTIHNIDVSKFFSTTLVWTDYPGTPGSTKLLVNDLDLIVTIVNSTASAYPVGTILMSNGKTSQDRTNNVERTMLTPVSSGGFVNITIKVLGFNVATVNGFASQQFAVVATGTFGGALVSQAPPTHVNPPLGSYTPYGSASIAAVTAASVLSFVNIMSIVVSFASLACYC